MTKEVLDYANEIVKEGITTDEIDKAVFFLLYSYIIKLFHLMHFLLV